MNILIVDDEFEIRELLVRHFEFLGHTMYKASDGREAVAVLDQKRIDLVITDILMPNMDGIQLLEYIHDEAPLARTIVVTGYVSLDYALSCLKFGAEDFILKPLSNLSELEAAVELVEKKLIKWQKKLRELRGMKPSG